MEKDQIIQRFIDFLSSKGRTNSTLIAYRKDIDQLLSYINQTQDKLEIQMIETAILQSYLDSLTQSGTFTLKTISRKINSIKTFFKHLHEGNLIPHNPAKEIKHPKFESRPPRVLSPLEYRALRDIVRGNLRLFTIVEVLLQTGIRIGELARLKRSHIDLKKEKDHMFIIDFSSIPARHVDLNDKAREALGNYLEKTPAPSNGEDHLFYTKTGRSLLIRNIRTNVNRAFNKAGIKNATVNDIRNTFIVHQLKNGIKIERLASIVGHQKSTTTERYMQFVEEKPKKSVLHIEPL